MIKITNLDLEEVAILTLNTKTGVTNVAATIKKNEEFSIEVKAGHQIAIVELVDV